MCRVENAFPARVETDRLLLRCYEEQDANAVLRLVHQQRSHLIREFAQQASLDRLEDAKSFIAEKAQQWESGRAFCYGIWENSSGEFVGQIQIKSIAWEIPAGELGYFIADPFQRRGFATESINAILRLAFEEQGFQRVFVRILPSNRESLALARKLGFQQEGLHRSAYRCGFGDLHDVYYLSMISAEFRQT